MIKITICWVIQLQGPEADIIERLVVNAERAVGILDKLMYRKRSIVWLNYSVGDLDKIGDKAQGKYLGRGDH